MATQTPVRVRRQLDHKRPIPTKHAHFKKYGADCRFIIDTIDPEAESKEATRDAKRSPAGALRAVVVFIE